jgi:CRP/FNR family transcriptional regulator, cyclic AMP receptor protein
MNTGERIGSIGNDRIDAAIRSSHLRALPSEMIDGLTVGAIGETAAAGSTLWRTGDVEPHFVIVVSGLVRVYVTAPDGRTLTVRYCRRGDILGAFSMFAEDFSMPATTQALVESQLLVLSPEVVRDRARADARVAEALLVELSERVGAFVREITDSAFMTVRQRIGRHLLDLASEQQRGADLVARISQQDLADAVGTVREVVVRVLRDLREEGVVETGRGGIRLVAPHLLVDETRAPVDRPASLWNESR